jgi:hypothetical protein
MNKTIITVGLIVSTIFIIPGCKEVFEKSLDKEQVVLSAPLNNLLSDTSLQSFFWQPVDSGVKFELQVVSPRFDSAVFLAVDSITQANQLLLVLPPAQYQWRVRAFNSSSTTLFSTPWNLTIK